MKGFGGSGDNIFADDFTEDIKKLDGLKSADVIRKSDDRFVGIGVKIEDANEVNDYFDIGIFSSDPDKAKDDTHVLKFDKEYIKTGENTLSFEVKEIPKYAGVDPYIKMIDRNSNDNMIKVELQK